MQMQSHPEYLSPKVKKEDNSHPNEVAPKVKSECDFDQSSSLNLSENTHNSPLRDSHLEEDDDVQIVEPEEEQYYESQNQLVVYNPEANGSSDVVPVPERTDYQPAPYVAPDVPRPRVLPSVGAFTVQCANCFKWRLIPTKEIYEQIRECILQQPFICERAREWRPSISCDDPADISQDGSRLWAIDKPNIAKPPPGWERLLRIRGEGGSKFADVYYSTPTGKKLRSMVDVQKYLLEHPEYLNEVSMSQFSFQIPKPLQENYVRKRPARIDQAMPRNLVPTEVNPISWRGPGDSPPDAQFGSALLPSPYADGPDLDATPRPAKRKVTRPPASHMYSSSPVYEQSRIKIEKPQTSANSAFDA